MKVNLEKRIVLEDVDVDVVFAKDRDDCVMYIDFVQYCENCDTTHIMKRFIPVDDDDLEDMLSNFDEEDENDYDEELNIEIGRFH